MYGAFVIETAPVKDHRGSFARYFCHKEMSDIIGSRRIVNINFSKTLQKGVVRGMHYQKNPKAEMKMVRCLKGAVYDVMIDIRKDSPTFLQSQGIELTEAAMNMVVIPEGFAHGFQVLEENSELLYLHTEYYSEVEEGALNPQDPQLGINWPLKIVDLSERDKNHLLLSQKEFTGIEI